MGQNNIPAFFLEATKFVIASYLSLFLNHIFIEGIYPRSYKIARIAPIHKGGAKNETNNYRPIFILTCFAKLIEKLIRDLLKFSKSIKLSMLVNMVFMAKFSTMHAMLDVVTFSYENVNDNCFTGLAFVDLRKAFDTVSHSTLLLKSRHYGIRVVALDLISSYLSNRKQYVSFNQNRSDMKTISYSVPQGSLLGPLFFVVYINDLNNALNSIPRLFADDTCLIVQSLDPKLLQNEMNTELEKLHLWCCANKPTIYPIKSNILIIPPKDSDTPTLPLNVTSNNT